MVSLQTRPRFLVVRSFIEEVLRKLSPCAIQKGRQYLAGEPKSVKQKLRNGSHLVECVTESHSRNVFKSQIFYKVEPIELFLAPSSAP